MANMKIPFNKPYFTGKETEYIRDAVSRGHISGNGYYTKKCQEFFQDQYGFKKCLLTTSCTDALEMAAILLDIKKGDEVIMPSFTFVSTANAFVLRGANVKFVDSRHDHPGMDEDKIEELITPKTKAIVSVHYAGVACDMDKIMALAHKYNLFVVEDAAQAIDSYYNEKPLGSIGHLATLSFHETKNISSGEGGMLIINDKQFETRSEIIWEKGTNRAAFSRGEVNKYEWIDIGSSFLPSDIIAAVLLAQLESIDVIQQGRKKIWDKYFEKLNAKSKNGCIKIPVIPKYATNNGHIFYMIMNSQEDRDGLISYLKTKGILSVFHYQSLANSKFYSSNFGRQFLNNADKYSRTLVRLPLYFDPDLDVGYITDLVNEFI